MNQQRIEPTPPCRACPQRMRPAMWVLRAARRRERPGQAITEFAMVVPVLLFVIYAMIIFALAIHTQIDFGNAISSGIRAATVDANGFGLANANIPDGTHSSPTNISSPNPAQPSVLDVDADIGNSMVANLRSDDRGSVQLFSIELKQGRPGGQPNLPDGDPITGAPGNTYKNVYCAIPVLASAPASCQHLVTNSTPLSSYNTQAAISFDQDAWNWASHWPGVSYCKYYYQAHEVDAAGYRTVYLDRNQNIVLFNNNPDIVGDNTKLFEAAYPAAPTYDVLYQDPRYPRVGDDPDIATGLSKGCNRIVTAGGTYPADTSGTLWTCSTAWVGAASLNNLCFYYPSERNTILAPGDNFPLPDLVEVKLQYLYNPIPTEISSKTPLGSGFTIVEHARGRLEPAVLPGS